MASRNKMLAAVQLGVAELERETPSRGHCSHKRSRSLHRIHWPRTSCRLSASLHRSEGALNASFCGNPDLVRPDGLSTSESTTRILFVGSNRETVPYAARFRSRAVNRIVHLWA